MTNRDLCCSYCNQYLKRNQSTNATILIHKHLSYHARVHSFLDVNVTRIPNKNTFQGQAVRSRMMIMLTGSSMGDMCRYRLAQLLVEKSLAANLIRRMCDGLYYSSPVAYFSQNPVGPFRQYRGGKFKLSLASTQKLHIINVSYIEHKKHFILSQVEPLV